MSNPRATVLVEGLRTYQVSGTYDNSTVLYDATKANGSSQVGLAVTITSGDLIALAGDGEFVYGKLLQVEADGTCVIERGFGVVLPGGTSASHRR